MDRNGDKGEKTEEKIQGETSEKMDGKNEKEKKRETKIQEESLEKMDSDGDKGQKTGKDPGRVFREDGG